ITLRGDGGGASVVLPLGALDDGIVFGRGRNGLDEGVSRVLNDATISCAHLLLLRDWGHIIAVDLCSTNGTRVAGRRIRRHRITAEDSTLVLGRRVTIDITRLEA